MNLQRLHGPALSCLLAFFTALAISKGVDALSGQPFFKIVWAVLLYWSIFVIVSGLVIDIKNYESLGQLLYYLIIPAFTLFAIWNVIPALNWIQGYSGDGLKLILVYSAIASISAAPAIAVSSIAMNGIKTLLSTDQMPDIFLRTADAIKNFIFLITTLIVAVSAFVKAPS